MTGLPGPSEILPATDMAEYMIQDIKVICITLSGQNKKNNIILNKLLLYKYSKYITHCDWVMGVRLGFCLFLLFLLFLNISDELDLPQFGLSVTCSLMLFHAQTSTPSPPLPSPKRIFFSRINLVS